LAPASPGDFVLTVTVLQEYVAWLEDRGFKVAEQIFSVSLDEI
jgi:hypothetical protein